jgi:hypothetical protein
MHEFTGTKTLKPGFGHVEAMRELDQVWLGVTEKMKQGLLLGRHKGTAQYKIDLVFPLKESRDGRVISVRVQVIE